MNPQNNMSLAGLFTDDLNALLSDTNAQIAAVNAQIVSAPVKAKQQLSQSIARLQQQLKIFQTNARAIQDVINPPDPTPAV